MRGKAWIGGALALVALAGSAVPAQGATVSIERLVAGGPSSAVTGVRFVAGPGEANAPVITPASDGNSVTITDQLGVPLRAGRRTADGVCVPLGIAVHCRTLSAPIAGAHVDLGDGDDAYEESQAALHITVLAGSGADRVRFDTDQSRYFDPARRTRAEGGPGADLLFGTMHSVIDGGEGDDTVDPGGAYATFVAGPGDDTVTGAGEVSYGSYTAPVRVTLDGIANDGGPGERDNLHPGLYEVWGGAGDDVMTSAPDGSGVSGTYLHGREGDDTLTGSAMREVITGGPGNDRLDGLGGHDSLVGGAGDDRVTGGAGRDHLQGDDQYVSGTDAFLAVDGELDVIWDCGRGDGDSAEIDGLDDFSLAPGQQGPPTGCAATIF